MDDPVAAFLKLNKMADDIRVRSVKGHNGHIYKVVAGRDPDGSIVLLSDMPRLSPIEVPKTDDNELSAPEPESDKKLDVSDSGSSELGLPKRHGGLVKMLVTFFACVPTWIFGFVVGFVYRIFHFIYRMCRATVHLVFGCPDSKWELKSSERRYLRDDEEPCRYSHWECVCGKHWDLKFKATCEKH